MILQFLYILADYLIKDERERVLNAINFNKADRTFFTLTLSTVFILTLMLYQSYPHVVV